MNYKVVSFYKYVPIENQEKLRDTLKSTCKYLLILGRILIGKEGINGAVCGKIEKIEEFKRILTKNQMFSDLTFREQETEKNTYHKLVTKARTEICAFGKDVDIMNPGIHLQPAELKQWYENNEEFIIVDARNEYEYNVGHFKNATKLPIQSFREFADIAPNELKEHKDKKIVFYCTGGIRCEKASAYMKERGFRKVYQLEGGIINYVNMFPNQEWEGGLFVFDDRLVSEVGEPITSCNFCHKGCEQYLNCHNLECDTLFICCKNCQMKMNKTCSKECNKSPRQRGELKPIQEIIGIVKNYYQKAGVALVRVEKDVMKKDMSITICGKTTTEFVQKIHELRDDDGRIIEEGSPGSLVTFPVKERIRKNDMVMVRV